MSATFLKVSASMTRLSANEAVRRPGYGGFGSWFCHDEVSNHAGYTSFSSSDNGEGVTACFTLYKEAPTGWLERARRFGPKGSGLIRTLKS